VRTFELVAVLVEVKVRLFIGCVQDAVDVALSTPKWVAVLPPVSVPVTMALVRMPVTTLLPGPHAP
jgi:hypothetical protein